MVSNSANTGHPAEHTPLKKPNPFPKTPTGSGCPCTFVSFAKTTRLRRVPQAFNLTRTPSGAPAWGTVNGPQVHRKKDPFSPQARLGDDGARRVNMLNKPLARTIAMQTYSKPDQYLKSKTRSG